MDQFVGVAIAHFLALLIPGVDFLLIARIATADGRRQAIGACLGITIGHGILVTAALSGLSLVSHPLLLDAVQVAGGVFLMYVGWAHLRSSAARVDLPAGHHTARRSWLRNVGTGIAAALLNPKNALFYVSLAAAVSSAAPATLALYGAWMVTVVLAWDVVVAVVLGSLRTLTRMSRVLPWLTAAAGVFLVLFGAGMVGSVVGALLGVTGL